MQGREHLPLTEWMSARLRKLAGQGKQIALKPIHALGLQHHNRGVSVNAERKQYTIDRLDLGASLLDDLSSTAEFSYIAGCSEVTEALDAIHSAGEKHIARGDCGQDHSMSVGHLHASSSLKHRTKGRGSVRYFAWNDTVTSQEKHVLKNTFPKDSVPWASPLSATETEGAENHSASSTYGATSTNLRLLGFDGMSNDTDDNLADDSSDRTHCVCKNNENIPPTVPASLKWSPHTAEASAANISGGVAEYPFGIVNPLHRTSENAKEHAGNAKKSRYRSFFARRAEDNQENAANTKHPPATDETLHASKETRHAPMIHRKRSVLEELPLQTFNAATVEQDARRRDVTSPDKSQSARAFVKSLVEHPTPLPLQPERGRAPERLQGQQLERGLAVPQRKSFTQKILYPVQRQPSTRPLRASLRPRTPPLQVRPDEWWERYGVADGTLRADAAYQPAREQGSGYVDDYVVEDGDVSSGEFSQRVYRLQRPWVGTPIPLDWNRRAAGSVEIAEQVAHEEDGVGFEEPDRSIVESPCFSKSFAAGRARFPGGAAQERDTELHRDDYNSHAPRGDFEARDNQNKAALPTRHLASPFTATPTQSKPHRDTNDPDVTPTHAPAAADAETAYHRALALATLEGRTPHGFAPPSSTTATHGLVRHMHPPPPHIALDHSPPPLAHPKPRRPWLNPVPAAISMWEERLTGRAIDPVEEDERFLGLDGLGYQLVRQQIDAFSVGVHPGGRFEGREGEAFERGGEEACGITLDEELRRAGATTADFDALPERSLEELVEEANAALQFPEDGRDIFGREA